MRAVGYQESLATDPTAALADMELPRPEPRGKVVPEGFDQLPGSGS